MSGQASSAWCDDGTAGLLCWALPEVPAEPAAVASPALRKQMSMGGFPNL